MQPHEIVVEDLVQSGVERYGVTEEYFIYAKALEEKELTNKGHGFMASEFIWSMFAPHGNIYNYMGYVAEHRRHAANLWEQLLEFCDRDLDVEGWNKDSREERARRLVEELNRAEVSGSETLGFAPLKAMFEQRSKFVWGFALPVADKTIWLGHMLTVCAVALVQIFAPLTLLVFFWCKVKRRWQVLRTLFQLGHMVLLEELFRCEEHPIDVLSGMLHLILACSIIYFFSQQAREQLENSKSNPVRPYWRALGGLIHVYLCVTVPLIIGLVLYDHGESDWQGNEIDMLKYGQLDSRATTLDVMGMLWLVFLDTAAMPLLGIDKDSFVRGTGWQRAVLASCPVRLTDLLNPRAKSYSKLWDVHLDKNSFPVLLTEAGTTVRCKTRYFTEELADVSMTDMSDTKPLKQTLLNYINDNNSPGEIKDDALYYDGIRDVPISFPRWDYKIMSVSWYIGRAASLFYMCFGTFIWALMNDFKVKQEEF